MLVKILINPTRLYSMAYDKGDVVEINDTIAQVMVDDGHAELVDDKGDVVEDTPEEKKPTAKSKKPTA